MALVYSDKAILAPMVRFGTLPFRLLALRCGADIVYSEEIIDFKMISCTRVENKVLGTVDFAMSDGHCVFRTCEEERNRVVFQMGTSCAARALQIAKLVENDVAGIDINMGCPKPFSLTGGMGAALLSKPEQVREILSTLVKGVKVPITCKIRLLPTLEETISFVKMVESTGVAAIALHGRYKHQRSSTACHVDLIKAVVESTSLPVIANGGSRQISRYDDIEKFRKATGAASVMVARAAMHNPSVFRKEGFLPWDAVSLEYFQLSARYQPAFANAKYGLAAGVCVSILQEPFGEKLLAARTYEEVAEAMGWTEQYDVIEKELARKEVELQSSRFGQPLVVGDPGRKYEQLRAQPEISEDGTMEMHITFKLDNYRNKPTPKSVLLEWARRNSKKQPVFVTTERSKDRTYKSVCTVSGQGYSSTFWERSKRFAEHAASLVCIDVLGIEERRWNESEPAAPDQNASSS
eukprot:scpid59608/ scgid5724/ tRNA-dihydrouridine(20) synthase [NAD(P)+]-like; Up-regulated in lung cancer protein 8; tRNA-dihydrouridine synthase 2-like